MGRQGVIGGVALVVLVGCIAVSSQLYRMFPKGLGCDAVSSAEYQFALNYGEELSDLEKQVPVTDGLAWGYYAHSCPWVKEIVAARVAAYLINDGGVAGGLVRLMFHDCFVQGCDGSILLKLASGSELNSPPNLSIRPLALQLIDDIKGELERACPQVVSCADIIALSATSAILQSGGPLFKVPLGRRDALGFGNPLADLPSPTATFAEQQAIFVRKGLANTADLVALAGAHTLGVAHCNAFNQRLLPTVDPKLNPNYAGYLIKNVCPTLQSTNATGLDYYTPNRFDNQYFKILPKGGALLASDQNLDQDSTAWNLVNQWADNQHAFFQQFVQSIAKMSQISTLTGTKGEIRKTCSTTNSGKVNVPVAEPEHEVEHILTTPTYTRASKPDLISMVTEDTASF